MLAKLAAAALLGAPLVFWGGLAAADDCRKVNLDDQHPSAPIGAQPKIKNLGPGEVYISLASAPVKDLSVNPNDLYRLTGFVLGPGDAVGPGSGHIVASVDNSAYVVQLAKQAVAAAVEICAQP
jgi:hypothetical protein